jgi:hypothetical protein
MPRETKKTTHICHRLGWLNNFLIFIIMKSILCYVEME